MFLVVVEQPVREGRRVSEARLEADRRPHDFDGRRDARPMLERGGALADERLVAVDHRLAPGHALTPELVESLVSGHSRPDEPLEHA